MKKQEIRDLLYQKHGSFLLSRKQAAHALNKSVSTIDRWRKQGIYLEYKKLGVAKNACVEYPIDTVADYIVNYNHKIV